MATQVKHRRGSDEEIKEFTPAISEIVYNTTTKRLHVGDGVNAVGRVIVHPITPEMFGATLNSNAVERTLALLEALNSSDYADRDILITRGEYAPIEISMSNKTIYVEQGAYFKLQDNTTNNLSTEPVSTVLLSGSNIEVKGTLTIDGNLANNPSDSLNTSKRIGAFHDIGSDNNLEKVKVTNASWVAVSVGDETNQSTGLKVDEIEVVNSRNYATSFWNLRSCRVGTVKVSSGVDTVDGRIRTGSQTSSTKNCRDLIITNIMSNDSVVVEARSDNVAIGLVLCEALKVEDASTIDIETIIVRETQGQSFSFALLNCNRVDIGTVNISNSYGDAGKVVAISGAIDCVIDTVIVANTKTDITDFEIRSAQGLFINNVILRSPDGNSIGFLFDYDVGHAPQEDIVVNNIISTGHTGNDIELQSYQLGLIKVGTVNKTATTNVEQIKRNTDYDEGTHIVSIAPTTGSISLSGSNNELSWTKKGNAVSVTGRLKVSAVSSPTGTFTIDLPFPAKDLPDLGGLTQFAVVLGNTTGVWQGNVYGQTSEGSNQVTIFGLNGNASFDTADKLQVNTTIGFNFTYFID